LIKASCLRTSADLLSEDKHRIRFDIAAELWPPHRLGDDVDGPTVDLVEALAEASSRAK
jgi:hypothetical protein